MNHLENDKRFYIYIHKDKKSGDVKYVGSGSGNRYSSIQDRSLEHLNVWDTLDKIILIKEMSKEESRKYEFLLIKNMSRKYTLFNKFRENHDVKEIDYKQLSEFLEYDETSPTFLRWIKRPIKSDGRPVCIVKIGSPAGNICSRTNYINISFLGVTLKGHRVVYALCNKVNVPKNLVVDHIDRNRLNNHKSNLRLATFLENNRNVGLPRSNTSGVMGVSWANTPTGGYWASYYNIDFKRKTKNFNPRMLYPDLPPEEAKQKAFEDAVAFRKQMEELYYK